MWTPKFEATTGHSHSGIIWYPRRYLINEDMKETGDNHKCTNAKHKPFTQCASFVFVNVTVDEGKTKARKNEIGAESSNIWMSFPSANFVLISMNGSRPSQLYLAACSRMFEYYELSTFNVLCRPITTRDFAETFTTEQYHSVWCFRLQWSFKNPAIRRLSNNKPRCQRTQIDSLQTASNFTALSTVCKPYDSMIYVVDLWRRLSELSSKVSG